MSAETEHKSLRELVDDYASDREHYKMIEGEFRVNEDKVDEIIEKLSGDILELAPDARDMLEALMKGADSEPIRWAVTKWVLEFAIKGGKPEDEMSRLISSLTKKK